MTNTTKATATKATPATKAAVTTEKVETKEVKVKRITSKSLATVIFAEELVARAEGKHETNKSFRQKVIARITEETEATPSSACTLYNTCKKEAELLDPKLGLGRDPKKEKPVKEPKQADDKAKAA